MSTDVSKPPVTVEFVSTTGNAKGGIDANTFAIYNNSIQFLNQVSSQAAMPNTAELLKYSPSDWRTLLQRDPESLQMFYNASKEIAQYVQQYSTSAASAAYMKYELGKANDTWQNHPDIDGYIRPPHSNRPMQPLHPVGPIPHPNVPPDQIAQKTGQIAQQVSQPNPVWRAVETVGAAKATYDGLRAGGRAVQGFANAARGLWNVAQSADVYAAAGSNIATIESAAGAGLVEGAGVASIGADIGVVGSAGVEAAAVVGAGAEAGVLAGGVAGAEGVGFALAADAGLVGASLFTAAGVSSTLGVSTAVASGILTAAAVGAGIAAVAAVGGIAYGIYRAAGGTEDLGDLFKDTGTFFSHLFS